MSEKFPEKRRNGKTRTPYFRPNRLLSKISILVKILKLYVNRRKILLLVMNSKLENKHSESLN